RIEYVRAGKLRALAVTTSTQLKARLAGVGATALLGSPAAARSMKPRSPGRRSAALSLSNRRLYVAQRIRGGLSGDSASAGSPPSLRRSLRARRRALSYLVSRLEAEARS